MPAPSTQFAPDRSRVAAETVDDEAIVVDLTTGVYYTMDAVAALIWSMLEHHQSVEQIVEAIGGQYIVSADVAGADVERVLDTLLEHQLIVPAAGAALPLPHQNGGGRLPYVSPGVHTYGDLSDLLAMDLPVPALPPWREPEQLRV